MARNEPCDDCKLEYCTSRTSCPHCGRPQRFPNVMAARDGRHKEALQEQYKLAKSQISSSQTQALDDLEKLAAKSLAVLCCNPDKLEPMIQRQFDLLPNYWDLHDLRASASHGSGESNWHQLRQKAEIELVDSAEHRERLHYAALSLDGTGLPHYGDCTIVLRESMIGHRATVYRTNSAMEVSQTVGGTLHPGGLAEWKDRGQLVATKLADQVQPGMGPTEFQKLLLRPRNPQTSETEDVFVEVLVFGELTMYSFASVSVTVRVKPTSRNTKKTRVPRKIQARYEVWRRRCEATRIDGEAVSFTLRIDPNQTSRMEPGEA